MHQTLINAWKRQAIEGMAGVFAGKAEAAAADGGPSSNGCTRRSGSWSWNVIFCESLRTMSVARRREMIEPAHPSVGGAAVQAGLDQPVRVLWPGSGRERVEPRLMRLIDEQFLETPWYGSRQMARHLRRQGMSSDASGSGG